MVHSKGRLQRSRITLAGLSVFIFAACGGGGGGGGSNGGTNSGGGSNGGDTTAPDTTIVTRPPAATTSSSASFTFSSSESGSTFEVSIDGGAFASSGASFDLGGLAEGEHTLSVRAIDAAKNVDASPATATWRVDFSAPTAKLFFPPAHSYTDATNITLRGKVVDASEVSAVKVNDTVVTIATDGTWTFPAALNAGDNAFVVSTTDSLGNSNVSASRVSVTRGGPTLSYVRGMDLDAANHRLLLADYERREILSVDLNDGSIAVFAAYDQSESAPLVDVANLVIDAVNHRVIAVDVLSDQLVGIDLTTRARTIISDSTQSTAGSTKLVAVAEDYTGIALDSANNAVYVTRAYDPSNSAPAGVLKISLADGTRTIVTGSLDGGGFTVGTGPAIMQSHDVVLDASTTPARLLVSHLDRQVMAVNTVTGERTTFSNDSIGSGPTVGIITRMRIDPVNGRLLVTSGGQNLPHGVFAINLANSNRTQLIDSSSASEPSAGAFLIALDSTNDRVYLSNFPTTEIFRADLSGGGKPVLIAHNNVGNGYKATSPRGVAISGSSLYFADTATLQSALIRVDMATGNRTVLSGHGIGTGPALGAIDSFVIDEANGRALLTDLAMAVIAVDLATGDRTTVSSNSIGMGAAYQVPTALAWDVAGNRVLVVDQTHTPTGALISVDPQGNRTPIASLQVNPFYLAARGLVLDGPAGESTSKALALLNGNLYGIDLNNGALTSYVSLNGNAMWIYPKQRDLLFTDGQTLSRYDFTNAPQVVSGRDSSGTIGTGLDLIYPNGVTADADANVAYVTDQFNFGVMAIDLTNGQRALMTR